MKKTTCNDLAGACDEVLTGETATEMGENSRNHVMQMVQAGDEAHKTAMEAMMAQSPEDQQRWYADFEARFDSMENA